MFLYEFLLRRNALKSFTKKAYFLHSFYSAGAGRTGTYIGMDVLFDQLGAEEKVNFVGCVHGMRQARKDMVQTLVSFLQ